MTEDDTQAVAEIKARSGFDYSDGWLRQGQTKGFLQGEFPQYTLIDDMWAAYRHGLRKGQRQPPTARRPN